MVRKSKYRIEGGNGKIKKAKTSFNKQKKKAYPKPSQKNTKEDTERAVLRNIRDSYLKEPSKFNRSRLKTQLDKVKKKEGIVTKKPVVKKVIAKKPVVKKPVVKKKVTKKVVAKKAVAKKPVVKKRTYKDLNMVEKLILKGSKALDSKRKSNKPTTFKEGGKLPIGARIYKKLNKK